MKGIRDALLAKEPLIGDEIEQLMAEVGERDPLPVAPGPNGPAAAYGPVGPLPSRGGADGDGMPSSHGPPSDPAS